MSLYSSCLSTYVDKHDEYKLIDKIRSSVVAWKRILASTNNQFLMNAWLINQEWAVRYDGIPSLFDVWSRQAWSCWIYSRCRRSCPSASFWRPLTTWSWRLCLSSWLLAVILMAVEQYALVVSLTEETRLEIRKIAKRCFCKSHHSSVFSAIIFLRTVFSTKSPFGGFLSHHKFPFSRFILGGSQINFGPGFSKSSGKIKQQKPSRSATFLKNPVEMKNPVEKAKSSRFLLSRTGSKGILYGSFRWLAVYAFSTSRPKILTTTNKNKLPHN